VDFSFHQILISHELGGAGVIALRIAQFIRNGNHGSHVWIPGNGPARKKAEEWGLINHNYDSAGVLNARKLTAAVANFRVAYGMRRIGPGVVHVHSPTHYGALRHGLRFTGLKRIVHVHLEEVGAGLRWAFKHPPDLIITCARFMIEPVRRSLPEPYQARQQIVAVPNAVDIQVFCATDKTEAKRRIGAPANVPLILMLANLAPHKGQVVAIRATAELKRRGTDAVCWLAGVERQGEGQYTAQLRSLIDELGVRDSVELLGYRDDAPQLLQAADFLLLPSTCEGLPLSILEAQASKVPVLAAPTAGIPEVVADGETGFLIHADDHMGYTSCIEGLLSRRDLYHRIADNAYENVAREHNWTAFCGRMWELYCELLETQQHGNMSESSENHGQ
jgi:glycosyltransferase involved in cell wall biosynthesis